MEKCTNVFFFQMKDYLAYCADRRHIGFGCVKVAMTNMNPACLTTFKAN